MFNIRTCLPKLGLSLKRSTSSLANAGFATLRAGMEDVGMEKKDPEMYSLLREEVDRQNDGIILIASENFASKAVMQAVGSHLLNKYSEGYPGQRYYGGCMVIDKIESLCQKRALQAYGANPDEWNVNVQPLSGVPANFAVYTGLVPPGGRLMGLDLPAGGHLSHGFKTPARNVSATSLYWDTKPYSVTDKGFIDYDAAYDIAQEFKPNMLI